MVATFPKYVCSKDGRMALILANARRYRARRKKLKSEMLDELTEVLHYNRRYLALLLRGSGKSIFTHHRTRVVGDPRVSLVSHRGRKKTYTAVLLPYLKTVWKLADGVSSVHLAAFIKANRSAIFRHPHLKHIPPRLKQQLLAVSPATIDRLRRLIDFLPSNNESGVPEWPAYDESDRIDESLDTLVPDNPNKPYDIKELILKVADEGDFFELSAVYAKNIVTGFGRIAGRTVGFVANQPMVLAGVLDSDASRKAARFVRFWEREQH